MSTVTALVFLLVNLAILTAGLAVIGRFFPTSRLVPRVLGLIVCWAAQVSLTVLLLGLTVGLSITLLIAANLSLSAVFILTWRAPLADSWRALLVSFRSAFGWLVRSRNYLLYAMLLLVGIQAAQTVHKIYRLPPNVYDELNLHLVPVITWFQQQRIPLEIDTSVTRINADPMGAKLLHFWFVEFFHDLTWVELPQFIFSFVILLSCYELMRFLRVRRTTALTFSLLIYAIPIFLIEARTCQDHVTLTALFLAGLVFLTKVIAGEDRYWWLTALAFGLMLGVKVSGPLYLTAVGVAWLAADFSSLRRAIGRLLRKPLQIPCLAVAAAILGGFWWLKNSLVYGNLLGMSPQPHFPDSPEPVLSIALMSNRAFVLFGTFAHNWSELFRRLGDTASDYSADLPGISGFGIQFFAFGILGYLLTLIVYLAAPRRRTRAGFILLTAVFLQLMYFFLYYSPYSYRLYLATPALGIVLWAYVFSLSRPTRLHTRSIEAVALLMICFSCLTTFHSDRTSPLKSAGQQELPQASRTTTSYSTATENVWETIDQYIPPDYPIAYLGDEDALVTPYYGNQLQRRVECIAPLPPRLNPVTERLKVLEILQHLRARGVKVVHVQLKRPPAEFRQLNQLDDRLFLLR